MLQKASRTSDGSTSVIAQYRKLGSVSSPLCVCESWKGYAVKHNYVNWDVLMTILDNYMFRPLLAIFSLSSRELVQPEDGQ